jgi:hypothetical protein
MRQHLFFGEESGLDLDLAVFGMLVKVVVKAEATGKWSSKKVGGIPWLSVQYQER